MHLYDKSYYNFMQKCNLAFVLQMCYNKGEVIKVNELPKYYTKLFNGVTDAIDALQHLKYSEGLQLLIQAQQEAEDLCLEETGEG